MDPDGRIFSSAPRPLVQTCLETLSKSSLSLSLSRSEGSSLPPSLPPSQCRPYVPASVLSTGGIFLSAMNAIVCFTLSLLCISNGQKEPLCHMFHLWGGVREGREGEREGGSFAETYFSTRHSVTPSLRHSVLLD